MTQTLAFLSSIIGFSCLVLALFLFLASTPRPLPNRLFAGFLLLTAIDISGWLIGDLILQFSTLADLRYSLNFLQMPLFVGFIVAACDANFRLRWAQVLHLIPFLLVLVWLSVTSEYSLVFEFFSHVQYYLYIAYVIYALIRFRGIINTCCSDSRSEVIRWLTQLVIVSLFAHSLVVVRMVASLQGAALLFSWLQIVSALIVLGVMTWITLKALLQPALFRGLTQTGVDTAEHSDGKIHVGSSTDADLSQQSAKLKEFMSECEPHLNPDLSLHKLAEQFGASERDLSELINRAFGMHFFDFVNSYRIASSLDLLVSERNRSVLDILTEVGFNSKSSFNTAFKKHTGKTPTAYRLSHSNG